MFQAVSSPLLRNEWLSEPHYNILQYLQVAVGWQSDPNIRQTGNVYDIQLQHQNNISQYLLSAEVITMPIVLRSEYKVIVVPALLLQHLFCSWKIDCVCFPLKDEHSRYEDAATVLTQW